MSPIQINDLFLARYVKGGRGPQAYDCFGLYAEVCRRRGMAIPTPTTPVGDAERATAIALSIAAGDWVALDAPQPWCAVALRLGAFVAHIGIVLADGETFLHMDDATGVSRERLDSLRWSRRIAGFYRHRSEA